MRGRARSNRGNGWMKPLVIKAWKMTYLLLLATFILAGMLRVNSWRRVRRGFIVAQAMDHIWTYQLRAYREWPDEPWLTRFRCEVGAEGRVAYMAPFPTGESPTYREEDCSVSLTNSGATFRVGAIVYILARKGRNVTWYRTALGTCQDGPSEGEGSGDGYQVSTFNK